MEIILSNSGVAGSVVSALMIPAIVGCTVDDMLLYDPQRSPRLFPCSEL